jgi:hypothetical protein
MNCQTCLNNKKQNHVNAICLRCDFGSEYKETNEIRVLKEFCQEFSPFYNDDVLNGMSYNDLIQATKEIAKEL